MHKYAYMAWDRNFSYFCENGRKRGAETHIRRTRAAAADSYGELQLQFQFEQKKFVFTCDSFADKFVSIQCRLIDFYDCFWPIVLILNC